MKSVLMVLILLPLICLLVSFFLYLINREKYSDLISTFQNKYTFPMPYQLHANMGYLGSPLITYFFSKLKQKKGVFFLEKKSSAYNFFLNNEFTKPIRWLQFMHLIYLIGFSACLILGLIAILIKLEAI
ncbi:hypothetical protein QE443_003151 [Pantoea ananatis]|nr:hypothetical protein [Pantoea ananatis]MDR6092290.1 hypothetical protein [Pantoea ananatis]